MDIEKEISKAMADPEIMNKVASVLSSLGNNTAEEKEESAEKGNEGRNLLGAIGGAAASDDRTRLLMAIKPFLSEKRAPYMDSAVTVLRLISVGKIGKDLKLF